MTEEQLRAQLDAVYSSTSWKITAPLRLTSGLFRKIRRLLYKPDQQFAAGSDLGLRVSKDGVVSRVIVDPDMSRDALNIWSELDLFTKQEKKEDAYRH